MPCDTIRRRQQSIQQRAEEVRKVVEALDRAILRNKVKPVVGPQGSITFTGWTEQDRDGVTDACAYRRLMVTGSAIAKAEIARAEKLAGRAVDRKVLTQGIHSHDGGQTWGKD